MTIKMKTLPLAATIAIGLSIPAFTQTVLAESDTDKVKSLATDTAVDKAAGFISDQSQKLVGNRIKHLDVSITEDDSKLSGEAKAVIGITETTDSFTFSQLSLNRRYERTTGNIGFGYRQIQPDDSGIIGANIFLDNEFDSGHQRAGVGLEYLSLSGSLHLNHYARLTDEKTVKGVIEKAMTGTDLTYAYSFQDVPFTPTVSIRSFRWTGDSSFKVTGNEVGLGLKLTDTMRLELFHKDESKSKSDTRAQISFVMPFGAATTSPDAGVSADASEERAQLRHMLYQPVKRENHIKKTKINLGLTFTTG